VLQDTATRVDFYVLETTTPSDRMHFACRLIEKAYKAKHIIYLLTGSVSQSAEVDKLLWTFRNEGFVPHEVAGDSTQDSNSTAAPIIIGHEQPDATHSDLLVNFSAVKPANLHQFKRFFDVFDASENFRNTGRQRFSDYRAAGLMPETHKIGNTRTD
jgi:DNA polymerase-3 subunit chi